jgi:hypothetical protein
MKAQREIISNQNRALKEQAQLNREEFKAQND